MSKSETGKLGVLDLLAWAQTKPRFYKGSEIGQSESLPRTATELFGLVQDVEERLCRDIVILRRIYSALEAINEAHQNKLVAHKAAETLEDINFKDDLAKFNSRDTDDLSAKDLLEIINSVYM
jgi:hypothetical protein